MNHFSSYVKWLDITRPGSKHSFEIKKTFFTNIKIGQKVNDIKKN